MLLLVVTNSPLLMGLGRSWRSGKWVPTGSGTAATPAILESIPLDRCRLGRIDALIDIVLEFGTVDFRTADLNRFLVPFLSSMRQILLFLRCYTEPQESVPLLLPRRELGSLIASTRIPIDPWSRFFQRLQFPLLSILVDPRVLLQSLSPMGDRYDRSL